MFFRKPGKFEGGIDLPAENRATRDSSVTCAPRPAELVIPIKQARGVNPELWVKPGDRVTPGEILARDDATSVEVISPAAGLVSQITRADVFAGRRLMSSDAIKLTDLSELPAFKPAKPVRDWQELSQNNLTDRIAESGMISFAINPKPLKNWLTNALKPEVTHLICNAVDDQSFGTATRRLLIEAGEEILQGLAILSKAIGAEQTTIAVIDSLSRKLTDIEKSADSLGVKLSAVPRKYPTGADNILIRVITGHEVKIGKSPASAGCAVVTPQTCRAIYRYIACDEKTAARIVTLAGDRAKSQGNFYLPIGTVCQQVCDTQNTKQSIIANSPVIGQIATENLVVTPSLEMLVATELPAPTSPNQCIRCGWCTDHCPARLNVAILNDMYELCDFDSARELGVQACVGCGVCSYICPAKLELSYRMSELKTVIAQQALSQKAGCDE